MREVLCHWGDRGVLDITCLVFFTILDIETVTLIVDLSDARNGGRLEGCDLHWRFQRFNLGYSCRFEGCDLGGRFEGYDLDDRYEGCVVHGRCGRGDLGGRYEWCD